VHTEEQCSGVCLCARNCWVTPETTVTCLKGIAVGEVYCYDPNTNSSPLSRKARPLHREEREASDVEHLMKLLATFVPVRVLFVLDLSRLTRITTGKCCDA
jgi:hypothetical protein